MPRDRPSTFEPQLIAKWQTRSVASKDPEPMPRHDGAGDPGPERALRRRNLANLISRVSGNGGADRPTPGTQFLFDSLLTTACGFRAEWGKRYSAIGQIWRNAWKDVVSFFAFAPGIRMIYTTDKMDKRYFDRTTIAESVLHPFFCSALLRAVLPSRAQGRSRLAHLRPTQGLA